MASLQDVLTKIENLVEAAESKAVDASGKASAFLRETADWIDAQATTLMHSTSPGAAACPDEGCCDTCHLEDLKKRCESLAHPTQEGHAVMQAGGTVIGIVLPLIITFLQQLLAKQPTPAAS